MKNQTHKITIAFLILILSAVLLSACVVQQQCADSRRRVEIYVFVQCDHVPSFVFGHPRASVVDAKFATTTIFLVAKFARRNGTACTTPFKHGRSILESTRKNLAGECLNVTQSSQTGRRSERPISARPKANSSHSGGLYPSP